MRKRSRRKMSRRDTGDKGGRRRRSRKRRRCASRNHRRPLPALLLLLLANRPQCRTSEVCEHKDKEQSCRRCNELVAWASARAAHAKPRLAEPRRAGRARQSLVPGSAPRVWQHTVEAAVAVVAGNTVDPATSLGAQPARDKEMVPHSTRREIERAVQRDIRPASKRRAREGSPAATICVCGTRIAKADPVQWRKGAQRTRRAPRSCHCARREPAFTGA